MQRHARMTACLVTLGFLIVVFGPLAVVAPPPIAMRTQGHALDQSGSPLPMGTPIRTFIDGVNYTTGRFLGDVMAVQDGIGSFAVLTTGNSKTNGNVSDTPSVQEGANPGDAVIYAAGDFTALTGVFQESFAWSPGNVTIRDMHLGASFSTPQPVKVGGIVTLPARGGNQFVFVCNPTGSPVSLADYFLERDAPGTYHGGAINLTGVVAGSSSVRVNLTSSSWLTPTGDALKLVYRNPKGGAATAGGKDIVVDRLEFNATQGGTLYWEPGNTILGDAPAPGPGQILQRDLSCTDTNDPRDFTLGIEPGLPANGPPTVAIVVPTSGQQVPAATTVTFSWTMSDDVFLSDYLHVWANVTIGNETIPLVVNQTGVMSVTWTTRDIVATDLVFRVVVRDPFGAHASASQTFSLTRQSPIALIVAILIAVVLLVFVVFGFRRARKREGAPPIAPPAKPPTAPIGPSSIAPPIGAVLAGGDKKVCPRCHTAVQVADVICFFCGYKFTEENTPPP
jgi:hypothetical protein